MSKSVERMMNSRSRRADYQEGELVFDTLKAVAKQVLNELREDRLKEVKTSFDLQPFMAPQLGERLLLLVLSKDERVNIPGDLEEEFKEIAAKHGEQFAKIWYYKQVLGSLLALFRKAARYGVYAWLLEWMQRRI